MWLMSLHELGRWYMHVHRNGCPGENQRTNQRHKTTFSTTAESRVVFQSINAVPRPSGTRLITSLTLCSHFAPRWKITSVMDHRYYSKKCLCMDRSCPVSRVRHFPTGSLSQNLTVNTSFNHGAEKDLRVLFSTGRSHSPFQTWPS